MGMRMLGVIAVVIIAAVVAEGAERTCANHPWPYANSLLPGERLINGQSLSTSTATLTFGMDGNLVLRRKQPDVVLWSSNTPSLGAKILAFEGGALFMLNAQGAKVWSTNTSKASIAVLQDDCNFVLYHTAPTEYALWTTGTNKCLRIHIVAHSHDDVGWLLSAQQYYDGCNTPNSGVRNIITTMVQALLKNPSRRYSQVEMYFFQKWWLEQNETTKATVRKLVANGQLEFVNAGWSMQDEGVVHQEAAVSNMALGAQFLLNEFGMNVSVETGWHIDPFGHGSGTPQMMAEYGFDAFYFMRIDYLQRIFMSSRKEFENIWVPSKSLPNNMMFTHIMFNGYGSGCRNPVKSMCVSHFCCMTCMKGAIHFFEELIEQHNPKTDLLQVEAKFHIQPNSLKAPTIPEIAAGYAFEIQAYAEYFRTNNVMIPWGDDFAFMDAESDFDLMDAVINEINSHSDQYGMTLQYSTPATYIKAIHALNYTWPENHHDYFLASQRANTYWVGYFTSRPAFKYYERLAMGDRYAVEMLSTSQYMESDDKKKVLPRVSVLQEACGVAQHHDGITGTERQAVVEDYKLVLAKGMLSSDSVVDEIFKEATDVKVLSSCPLMNLSSCPALKPLFEHVNVSMFIYNPLQQSRHEVFTVPVPTFHTFPVLRGTNKMMEYVETATWALTQTDDPASPHADHMPYQLQFALDLRPHQMVEVILVSPKDGSGATLTRPKRASQPFEISNEFYKLTFSQEGVLQTIGKRFGSDTRIINAKQNLYTYCPASNAWGQQASGAYIMRTCSPFETPQPFSLVPEHVDVITAPLCQEVRQTINRAQNLHQLWRLCRGQRFIEVVTGVGELNPGSTGLEVIMKLDTEIATNETWYTDSYGLELQKRVRNQRPNYPYIVTEGVAGNFMPTTAFSYMNGTLHNQQCDIGVAGDRSRAVGSLEDGSLEFLIHRRLLFDDKQGVDQALNESDRIITTSRLYVAEEGATIRSTRLGSLLMSHPPIIRFGAPSSKPYPFTDFDGSDAELPAPVHLHTRMLMNPRLMLVRLQHLYSVDETAANQLEVQVDIKSVMPRYTQIQSVVETDLNGMMPLTRMNRLNFRSCDLGSGKTNVIPARTRIPHDPAHDGTTVTLHPMEIRTFWVRFEWVD